ncbi:T9SS type A sorting domain-containing protein [Chishuiella sp.]|uniref:T9SS type A sorting domain-containing protein n=1 Tax=Chishuiella sp. TaxID=1969467 RepID=UPI0028ACC60C|nr:T9SS type A sorting domain-containing protein [Chishuiella sp.]
MKQFFIPFLLISTLLNAQKFEEVQTNISNYGYGSLNIGDFNNDGFQDLLICGDNTYSQTQCDIYKNDNGTFTHFQKLSQSTYLGDLRFVNLRNDDTLDIILTGQNRENIREYKTYQYQFKNNNYELINSRDGGKIYSSFAYADFDHDGQLDLFLNGIENSTHDEIGKYLLHFLKNNKGELTYSELLGGSQNGDFVISDFNNDGLLDLAIFGINGENESEEEYGAFFNIYLNNNGTLELSEKKYGMLNGSIQSADFNGDGFQDIVITGLGKNANDSPTTLYLENDGYGKFIEHDLGKGVQTFSSVKSMDIGDLNNDGYYDILMIGEDEEGEYSSKIFTYNPQSKDFSLEENTGLGVFSISTSLRLFDYNNDNHLDLVVVSGDELYEPKTSLYKNISTETNNAPTPPTSLKVNTSDDKAIFSWNGATDDKTPINSLQYELSIGSEKGKSDILKYIVTTNNWFINKDILPKNFYWSVKSIDASRVYSKKSDEQSVDNLSTNDITIKDLKIYPNPTRDFINIQSTKTIKNMNIYNLSGQKVMSQSNSKTVNVHSLNRGIYIVEITLEDGQTVKTKLIKQ